MRKSVQESLSMQYSLSLYKKKPFFSFCKRTFDIVSSGLAMILFCWLFLIIILLIKCTSKGPAFYGHSRVGKGGKVFKVWKFRSMHKDDRPLEEILTKEQLEEYYRDFKVTDDPRVTKIGKFLRKTSLDELPQIVNILKGEMSIIGPRPVVEKELEKYGDNKNKFLSATPGLTGYWAANGRSDTTYEQRMQMELYYIDNFSLKMDVKIFFKTIVSVLKKEGAI